MREACEPSGSSIVGAVDRRAARDIALAIAEALETSPRGYSLGRGHDLALADGDAGIAVLLAELPEDSGAAEHSVTRAIEGIGTGVRLDASLHLGFTGIAWAWQRVMARNDDALAAVDQALLELVCNRDARIAPGLLFGLAGIAVYALERNTADADACIAAVVERLLVSAERDRDGLRWWLPPPPGPADVERFPTGFYDLGLDVGAAGIIAVCTRIAARGIAAGGAREIVAGAARWLLGQRTARGLPSKLGVGGDPVDGFGWCKGELGIAVALLDAALATRDASLHDAALDIAHRAADADPARCHEPGFHIGAAGAMYAC